MDDTSGSLDLNDFLGKASELYTSYTAAQSTQDAAKIAQARAELEAQKTQGQFAITERTKTILLYTVGGIVVVILVLFLIKKFK